MKTVSVLDFGARGDGCLCTKAIQAAIDDCFLGGGGQVEVPEGNYLTGGLRLRSNVVLHLLENAVLIGTRNPEDYYNCRYDTLEPMDNAELVDSTWSRAERSENKERDYAFLRLPGSRWHNSLIRAIDAENIAIIGEKGSVIDGNDCYDEQGEEYYRGPHAIGFFRCKNIQLSGYTVQRSGNWAHNLFYCSQVTMDGVTVLAGHDGIHMTGCKNMIIQNSNFYTGDDCIAGFANLNVFVENCEVNSACSGFRMGGSNVMITHCHIFAPGRYAFRGSLTKEEKMESAPSHPTGHRTNMLSAFTYYSDFSVEIPYQPGNIVISDTRIEGADKLFHYNRSGNELWQTNRPLKNIFFEHVVAKDLAKPTVLYGEKDFGVTAVFSNVHLTVREGCETTPLFWTCNYDAITFDNVAVEGGNDVPLIQTWSEGKISIKNLLCKPERSELIEKLRCPFEVKRI